MSTKPDPHEAEVRRIAEILASIHNPLAYSRYNKKGKTKEYKERNLWCIDQEMNAARAMLEEIQQVVRFALEYEKGKGEYINKLLIQLGLIPSPKTTDHA